MNRSRPFSTVLKVTAVIFAYTVLAVISTWPLANHLSTHLTDHFGDGALHLWNIWWVRQALSDGQLPFFTDRLFYPNGVSLVTQNFAWFHIIPALLHAFFFNKIAAFNIAVLLNLVLCGVVMFWVAYRLTRNAYAAFIAGLIYQIWPYRLARLDLPNTLATYWIPLFLLFLILTIERGRQRYAILGGICLALVGYARWQFVIPASMMGAIILIFYRPFRANGNRRKLLANLAMMGATAALLLLSPILLLINDEASYDNLIRSGNEEVLMSADLFAFATPSQHHAVLSESTKPLHDRYYFDRERLRKRPSYIGLIPLLLGMAGICYYRRRALAWLAMGLVLLLFALGPVLRINGIFYERIPLPYTLLEPLRILELMRNPERFVIFLALPVAMLAAYGMAGLLANNRALARVGWLLTAVLSGFIIFEYYSPQVVLRDYSHPPAIYQELATEEGSFAILNLPFDDLKAREYMGDQTEHERPIVQGNLSRIPQSAGNYFNNNPWLSTLNLSGEMAPGFLDISRQLGFLAADDIRYLVMHKDKVGGDRIDHWRQALIAKPRYEDETRIVYSTAPQAGRDFDLPPGWGSGPAPLSVTLSAGCLHAGHVLAVSSGWGTVEPPAGDLDLYLALVDGDGQEQVSARFPLVEEWPASDWTSNSLAWGHYLLDLPGTLQPGVFDLQFTLLDSASNETTTGPHLIYRVDIQEVICNLATEEEAADANMIFDDQLRLVEYKVRQEDEQLKLRLYWRGERFVEQEYTIFVHVFDRETTLPVAQFDGRPHGGAYPMRYWWPGEVVEDRVAVSLAGVMPGEYGIAIGVYDASTGVRLPLLDQNGQPLVEDGRFVLPQTVTIP